MELNREISLYLNGSYFPSLKSESKKLKRKLKSFSNYGSEKIPHIYEEFYKSNKTKYKKTIKKIKFLKKIKDNHFLKPLKEFQEYVNKNFTKKEIFGVYVHGSLATGDYIENYSDFDALIIIKKEVLSSEEKMKKVRKKIRKANTFLYLLDPLQHHELFIITEYDMQHYFEPIFPLELFKYAREVTNFQEKLEFRCLDDSHYLSKIFNEKKISFNNKKKYKFNKKNSYHIKNAIQNILILPTIYLQTKNKKYLYKKYSFEKAKKDFQKKDWKIIEKCSQVRTNCPYFSYYPYFLRKFIGFNFHYKFLKFLHRYLDRNNSEGIIKILGENFLDEAKILINKMENKLKNEL